MALLVIVSLVTLDLVLSLLDSRLELLLLVVKLVLQGQEVLIQGNTVAQERFIATRLILLVHLLVLQQLNRCLHRRDLPLQVSNDLTSDLVLVRVIFLPRCHFLDFVGGLSELRVPLKLSVDDGAGGPLIDIVVGRGELDTA